MRFERAGSGVAKRVWLWVATANGRELVDSMQKQCDYNARRENVALLIALVRQVVFQ